MYSVGNSVQCSVMTKRAGMGDGGREAQEGRDVCMPMTVSCLYTAEISTGL